VPIIPGKEPVIKGRKEGIKNCLKQKYLVKGFSKLYEESRSHIKGNGSFYRMRMRAFSVEIIDIRACRNNLLFKGVP
jgi:hypothetical protein